MASLSETNFTLDYKKYLIDEISLEGLEGIGIIQLWNRMEKRVSIEITEKMKMRYWKFITDSTVIMIYQVNDPPPVVEIVNRFTIADERTGHMMDPPDYLDGPYEYNPVKNEYGSCSNYDTRLLIPKNAIQLMTYEEVILQYDYKIVLVASLEERWKALAPHLPMTYLSLLTPVHYCILELIGKGRENGQMTTGMTNLSKIVKQPKLLFYNRNLLQKVDLIKKQYGTQVTGGKAMKSILLRLKRFHQSTLQSLPKAGRIHNMIEYLLNKHDHSEQTEVMIKKGLLTPQQIKRLQKAINIFNFEEREVKLESKNTKTDKQKLTIKKRFIYLTSNSDQSSESEEEDNEPPLQCQYKVGVSLMRQAYERFLDAGLNGLTQIEVAQLLGVEFYTSRAICRNFKARKIVREFLEDQGRQRTTRYIAVAATNEVDKKYAEEKNKLLKFVEKCKVSNASETASNSLDDNSEYEVPIKKMKFEQENIESCDDMEPDIIELKHLEGYENVKETILNSKKNPTLRQLKFANGILKVVHELKFVIGFQTLGTLVSKEINEPPMDTKALRLFVQKLVLDGQLKIIKIKRPKHDNKHTILICSSSIKATDPIIKSKYNELCAKTAQNAKPKNQYPSDVTRPLSQYIYPRYMKIQKLHEFIAKLIYFDEKKTDSSHPPGFGSLFYIIPEMTVEQALGNISNIDVSDVAHLKLNEELYNTNIRDAPDHLGRILLQSKSLQNSIRIGLKVLAVLGLIQLINQPSMVTSSDGGLVTYVFYVNRRAKILDTSGKWPRQETDLKMLEKSYHFQSIDDITNYWSDVSNISSNTVISIPKRERYRLVHPMRNECSVLEHDIGLRFGDGLGPCGFDSSIFMDIPRLWRTFIFRTPTVVQPVVPKPKPKIIRKKKAKSAKPKQAAKPEDSSKKLVKKNNLKTTLHLTKQVRTSRRKTSDSLITWTEFEDRIIMMCKAAMTIMSPVSQPGSLKIRNTVAKDLLSIFDPKKTAVNCHKRALTLETYPVLTHEKDCIINELRRRRNLIKKYEGFLKVIRLRHHVNITRYINEAKLPMLELIWLISQIKITKSFTQRVPCIAINIDDFQNKYNITSSSANRPYNMYKTSISNGPEIATLKEAIVLTVMLSINQTLNSDMALKIYLIFKKYSEPVLRSAIEQLRKCGAIAAREKILNNHFNKVNFDDIVQSSYKISAVYKRKWSSRLEGDFADNLADNLVNGVPNVGLKGTSDLNCLLCELCSCNVLDIVSDTIPVVSGSAGSLILEEQMNFMDMETKYKLKSGLVGWSHKSNIKKFTDIFQDYDYNQILEDLSSDAIVESFDQEELDIKDEIIKYLLEKKENGLKFSELKELLSINRKALCTRLKNLEENKIIKRVGIYENRIVLRKYSKPYLLEAQSDLYIIPTPWLNLEAQIQKGIFLKWATVIMNKIFEYPGCSLEYLSNSFEYISTRSIQDACIFLKHTECITVYSTENQLIDLFSENDEVLELHEYNCYDSPELILVFPVKNCLTRFTYIKRTMLTVITD